jgi:hypothetical protein
MNETEMDEETEDRCPLCGEPAWDLDEDGYCVDCSTEETY